MEAKKLLLASNSPRRKQLLALGNWEFDVIVSDVDESQLSGESPQEYVTRLALAKAQAVAGRARLDHIIIGSDTAVVDGNTILGKPVDQADAERMLRQLRGHTHQVFTAVAFYRTSDSKSLVELCITDVPMRDYSDEEINPMSAPGIQWIRPGRMPFSIRVFSLWLP